MKRFFIILTLTVVASFAAPVAAQEQPTPEPTTPAPVTPPGGNSTSGEAIDNATTLVSSSFDRDTETAHFTIRSEIPQKITISDSGDFIQGGNVDQRSIFFSPGETKTIEMKLTVADTGIGQSFAGVSITTAKSLYAEPLQTSSPLIGGPWTHRDAQLVGVVTALTVSGSIAIILLRGKYDLDADQERIA